MNNESYIKEFRPIKPPSTMKRKMISLSMASSSSTPLPPPIPNDVIASSLSSLSMASSSSTPLPPPIPNDVIVEILSWVSVSSLMRLRWTCKYWFDLITRDHVFSKLQSLRHHDDEFMNHNNTSLLIFKLINTYNSPMRSISTIAYNMKCRDVLHQSSSSSSSPKTILKMDFYNLLPVVTSSRAESKLLGSCNGLICIHQFIRCLFTDKYFLCNPSTREWKELPQPPKITSSSSMPREFDFIHGFGYDHTIEDYKVIRIAYRYDDVLNDDYVPINSKQVVHSVYTLGSNLWHEKNEMVPLFEDDRIKNRSGLFANGALHWMIFPLHSDLVRIITFDITKEEHGEILCPEVFFSWLRLELTVLNGCLWVFHQNHSNVDVWIMKDYGVKKSWTKIFTMNIETLVKPVKYLKDSGILMLYSYTYLVAYDTKNNKVGYVQKIEEPHHKHTSNVVTYVETLVSLNSGWILAPGSTTNKRPRTEKETM